MKGAYSKTEQKKIDMKSILIKFIRLRYYLRRKLSLKINKDDVVLEIGPGGKPHFRSNVICDKFYKDNTERSGDSLAKKGTFLILGDAESLPFRDKSFDYIIASHLLEHLYKPQDFFEEIMRVGKAGYIETPTMVSEKVKSIKYHVNFVKIDRRTNTIEVIPKKRWIFDEDLTHWWLSIRDKTVAGARINFSDHFFLRFFWENSFNYKISNNETLNPQLFIKSNENDAAKNSPKKKTKMKYPFFDRLFRRVLIPFFGYLKYSKGPIFDIREKVCCPHCQRELFFEKIANYAICNTCRVKYKSEKNILYLRKEDAISF